MRPARRALILVSIGAALALAGVLSARQAEPVAPMQIEKVKDNLYLIRSVQSQCAQWLRRALRRRRPAA